MAEPFVYDDGMLRDMLGGARVIAVVGYSPDPSRTSYRIARYLKNVGYTVYPVNPTVSEIDGLPAYAALVDVPEQIDIVNVFRRSEYLADVVRDAVAAGAKNVWAQLGVSNGDARRIGEAAGIPIVMDRCIMVDHRALLR